MTVGRSAPAAGGGPAALVTGASRGLGLAVATELVRLGYRVAMTGRDEDTLVTAAARLGDAALPLAGDVGEPDVVRAQLDAVSELLGPPVVVVNNAGHAVPETLVGMSDGAVLSQMRTNLLGPMWVCRAAAVAMSAAGGGHIVNVSTESVRDPLPMLGVYAAAKAGLETFSGAFAEEVAELGIRVSLFRAGRTVGGFSERWDADKRDAARSLWERSGRLARMSPGRMSADDAARTLVSLVASPSSGYISELSTRPLD